jgi:hypothetical protein
LQQRRTSFCVIIPQPNAKVNTQQLVIKGFPEVEARSQKDRRWLTIDHRAA